MDFNWELIIYALFLMDSVGAVLISWFGQNWWFKHMGCIAVHFPPAKGWTTLYLVFVLVVGIMLF